ncbi:MAG: 50S ribosomal protein L24 [Flavobacteriales bacterium]|jgi:large subunit ribosomal protein L24
MYKRYKVKKGDQVRILAGKNKGEQGEVILVDRKTDRVIVKGYNMITKHNKPTPTEPQGGIEKKEAPIHISNVMVIDNQGNATRVGRRRNDEGKLVRYSKKSGQEL